MEAILYKPTDKNKEYWIGTNGVLFSLKTRLKAKPITWQYHDRYVCSTIRINGVPTRVYQHRLLAKAFIPNPSGKKEVNHIDFDRFNNSLDNLEWVSPKENSSHYMDNNRLNLEKYSHVIIKNSDMLKIYNLKSSGMSSREISRILGFKARTIRFCLSSKRYKEFVDSYLRLN